MSATKATVHVAGVKVGPCPRCEGGKKPGVIFHPVTDVPGSFQMIHALETEFLCVKHFVGYVAEGGHVVQDDELRRPARRKLMFGEDLC